MGPVLAVKTTCASLINIARPRFNSLLILFFGSLCSSEVHRERLALFQLFRCYYHFPKNFRRRHLAGYEVEIGITFCFFPAGDLSGDNQSARCLIRRTVPILLPRFLSSVPPRDFVVDASPEDATAPLASEWRAR